MTTFKTIKIKSTNFSNFTNFSIEHRQSKKKKLKFNLKNKLLSSEPKERVQISRFCYQLITRT